MTEPSITTSAYHMGGANTPVNRVVIHSTSPPGISGLGASQVGQAHSTAMYFARSAAGGSAHYIVDVRREEHCVPDDTVAWHAPPNTHSLGIEICGQPTYTTTQWSSPQVWPAVVLAALRCRDLCARHGVPVVRLSSADLVAGKRGICGHVDVSNAWHETDHTDPGPNFPWVRFLEIVRPSTPQSLPPTLPGTAWEYQEEHVRTSLVLVGPLDDHGRGYDDWYPGMGGAPVVVGAVKQGPDPSAGSVDTNGGDPYWEKQGNYTIKASPRGMAVRVVVTDGVPGQTVGVYVSAA